MARTNDYFKMLLNLINYSCESAVELNTLLRNFNYDELTIQLSKLHAIEHAADEALHEVIEKLAAEFITPIDREDIVEIAAQIDDITDAIEDVLIKIYMFNIKTIRPEALEFCGIIVSCCEALRSVFEHFSSFKKPKELYDAIIAVNTLEEDGDRLYMKSVRRLYSECKDPIEVVAWTDVFSKLEKCCDQCEMTANVVKSVIMKNS